MQIGTKKCRLSKSNKCSVAKTDRLAHRFRFTHKLCLLLNKKLKTFLSSPHKHPPLDRLLKDLIKL